MLTNAWEKQMERSWWTLRCSQLGKDTETYTKRKCRLGYRISGVVGGVYEAWRQFCVWLRKGKCMLQFCCVTVLCDGNLGLCRFVSFLTFYGFAVTPEQ